MTKTLNKLQKQKKFLFIANIVLLASGLLGLEADSAIAKNEKKEVDQILEITPDTSCSRANLSLSTACSEPDLVESSNLDVSEIFGITDWMEYTTIKWGKSNEFLAFSDDKYSGSWTLTDKSKSELSGYSNFMAILQGKDYFAAYQLSSFPLSGTWDTDDLIKKNNKPKLSRFSIYVSNSPKVPVVKPASDLIGTAVPEPLTILGAATATGFGAFFKRYSAKTKKKD